MTSAGQFGSQICPVHVTLLVLRKRWQLTPLTARIGRLRQNPRRHFAGPSPLVWFVFQIRQWLEQLVTWAQLSQSLSTSPHSPFDSAGVLASCHVKPHTIKLKSNDN